MIDHQVDGPTARRGDQLRLRRCCVTGMKLAETAQ